MLRQHNLSLASRLQETTKWKLHGANTAILSNYEVRGTIRNQSKSSRQNPLYATPGNAYLASDNFGGIIERKEYSLLV